MDTADTLESLRRFEIPGRVTAEEGKGGLPMLLINTDTSTAEIYLHGATVTNFQKRNEAPILFVSQCSRFDLKSPIRGGIPVIFPWFGPREGEPTHGFARLADWHLHEVTAVPSGGVSLRFSLPDMAVRGTWLEFTANYVVTVAEALTLELIITNTSAQPLVFEDCLHTYFTVGDIHATTVEGLKGVSYLDKVDNFTQRQETAEVLKITGETDRVYLDTADTTEIHDGKLHRSIRIEKSGSRSTVVWNPWITKSKQMPDFGDEEYLQMLCVESGNVAQNKTTLAPGRSAVLKVVVSSHAK